jgi:hypothetical protein
MVATATDKPTATTNATSPLVRRITKLVNNATVTINKKKESKKDTTTTTEAAPAAATITETPIATAVVEETPGPVTASA